MIEHRIPAARALSGNALAIFHTARDLTRAVEPDRRPNAVALLDAPSRWDEIARLWRVAAGRSLHDDTRTLVIRKTNRGRISAIAFEECAA